MPNFLSCLAICALLKSAAAQGNPISGATLFTGPAAPIVDLGYAQYQGKQDDRTKTSNYLGLKYANAPRFDHSTVYQGDAGHNDSEVIDVSDYGPACAQHEAVTLLSPSDLGLGQAASLVEATPLFQKVLKQSEDCLSINVQRPQDESLKGLPVLMWIHGGGFEAGASSSIISEVSAAPGIFYQGANLVKRSLDMGQPILFTSIQYRLADFGFTASKEFEDAGILNLGLEDQRNAMRWIQQNIEKFGGDPSKVTIMGESAGSWSVAAHLVANRGDNEGLFRGAIGMSGGPLKVEGPERQQGLFDDMAEFVGCGSESDKVACLRKAPFEKIYEHMGRVNYFLEGYRSLASAWTLRGSPNDKLLSQSPDKLAAAGQIAKVPLLMGDMKDEGPLFSTLTALNTTTEDDVKDYFKTVWWPKVTEAQLDRLLEVYPSNPPDGSPYDTGYRNTAPGPQYKRIASIVGDYSFQAQRRKFFTQYQGPIWSYETQVTLPASLLGNTPLGGLLGGSGILDVPVLGSFHAFDVLFYVFETLPAALSNNVLNIMSTWISFVHNLDPNEHGLNLPHWPQYDQQSKQMFHFQESGPDIITDDYRAEAMDYINGIGDSIRI